MPAPITSSDGVVTVVPDDVHASTLIRVDGADGPCTIWRRDTQTGVREVVRSGDPCLVLGGYGVAYDHEVYPGRVVEYTAVIAGVESAPATVSVPWQAATSLMRCPTDPSLSMPVRPSSPGAISYEGRSSLGEVDGARTPYISHRPWSSGEWPLALIALTESEVVALLDLLMSGPILWTPHPSLSGRARWLYALEASEQQYGDIRGAWVVSTSMREVDRPDPTGAPMVMPNWPWGGSTASYTDVPDAVADNPGGIWDLMLKGIGA